jgi:hypothetical protein
MGLANRPIGIDHLHSIRPVRLSSGQLASPNAQLNPQLLHLVGPRLRLHLHSLQLHRLILYPTNQQPHYMVARPVRYRSRDHLGGQRWRSQRGWGQRRMTQRNHQRGQGGRDVARHHGCWRGRSQRGQGRHFKRRKGNCRRGADRWRGLGRRRARRNRLTQKLCHPRMTPLELSQVLSPEEPPFYAKRSLHHGHRFLNIGEAPLPTHVADVRVGTHLLL